MKVREIIMLWFKNLEISCKSEGIFCDKIKNELSKYITEELGEPDEICVIGETGSNQTGVFFVYAHTKGQSLTDILAHRSDPV